MLRQLSYLLRHCKHCARVLLPLLAFTASSQWSSTAHAQTVYRWIADDVDFGEAESPWNNAGSWAGSSVPPTTLVAPTDVVELNGDAGNGFNSITREITINATTGSMTVGTLRFGDRDTGSALILTNATNNPVNGQTEGLILNTSTDHTADPYGADGQVTALYHGIDNLGTQDVNGILSVGSDVNYGNSGDAIQVPVYLDDADGFVFDGFFNFRIDSPMVVNPGITGGADFWKRGQGILFFDENDDTFATNGSLIGVKDLYVEEGELRIDGDNTDPDGVGVLQVQNNIIVGTGTITEGYRSVIPVLRLYRNNTGANISSTYTGTSATSEVGGNIQLNTGILSIMNSSIGSGGGEVTIEPDIVVSGSGNQLQLNRANNNSETFLFSGVISGSGELHKDDNGRAVFSNNNTFTGVLGVGQQSDDNGGNLGGVELVGANGAFSGVSEVRIYNNGTLVLENADTLTDGDGALASITGAINNDRINDAAKIVLQDLGKLEIVGSATGSVSETVGAVEVVNGRPAIEFDLNNGTTAGQIALTVASITRAAGSELRIRVEDGYDQAALPLTGAEYSVTVADNGVALGSNLVGGGGSAGSTNISVVRGVTIDISNNMGGRIAGLDGSTLRPLDHDPSSPTFEFLDATGVMTGGSEQVFDATWNTTNGTDTNVMWYFTQDTPTISATVDGADFESGRLIMDDVTINSAYLTGLNNAQQGGNDNFRRTLAIDEDSTLTINSGVLVFGRQTASNDVIGSDAGTNPNKVQEGTNDIFITGGTIDFGEEGFIKNRNNNSAYITSDIVTGAGGLTVSAPNWVYFHGDADLGGGNLTINEGAFNLRGGATLANTNEIHVEANGYFIIRDGASIDGINMIAGAGEGTTTGTTATPLRVEAGQGTVANSDIILSNVDQLGEAFGTVQVSQQVGTILNLQNVNIYQDDVTKITSDGFNGDPQTFQFYGESSVINFDGIISDVKIGTGENGTGALAPVNSNDLVGSTAITSNGYGVSNGVADALSDENFHMRVRIDGGNISADRFNPYNELGDNFVINFERSGQQFNGKLDIGNGILRFTDATDDNDGIADGSISFFHDEVVNSRDFRDFWTSFYMVDDITGNDNRAVLMMTQPGQVFNVNGGDTRADTDSSEDNFAIFGYSGLDGSAQFGDTTYDIGGGYGKRLQSGREIMLYAAGDRDSQGTLNWRLGVLDPGTERDGELTKIGRGVVNMQKNPIADDGSSTFQFDFGLNMFGGDLVFDFDVPGDTGMQFTSNDTNGASTPDLRFQGGALRILGDTNETRNWSNIDGDLIVNQGRGEFEYRAQGGNATITAGGTSTNVIRTAGGQLNFVVDTTNIGAGTFKATYQNATISAGSADNVFDSRMGGAFTVGGQADTAVNWAAFDSEWELGSLADAFFNGGAGVGTGLAAFGAGIDTQIEDAVVSTGAATSTGSMRIDAGSTVTFGSAAGSFVVEDGILIPTTNAGAVVFDGPMDLTGTVKTGSATTENELMIHNYGSGGLDIQNVIADNGAKTSLTIGGTGTTTLSGVNTHTGNTYINGGSTVVVDADSDFGVFDTTNGYGIHDVLVYFGGDNYESSAGGTTLDFVAPIPGSAGSGALSGSEVAPTTTIDSPNDLGVRNVLVTAGGSGYTARPIAVFNDTVDATGTNHGQGARAAVVLDGGNVVLNGGTLQVATGFELDSNRSIVLQGDGGTINVADGETLIYQGVIVPERHTSRSNNGSTYAEYFSGDLDINADGSTGTFRLGALIADGTNHVIQDGGLNNIYQGLTNIYAGTVEVFGQPMETQDGDVSGQQSTQSYIQPFGSVASFEDGTIMHENTTLRIMLNAGDQSATAYDGSTTAGNNNLNDTVRIMEWFTFKDGAFIQEGSLDGAADDTNTGRNVSLSGVLQIEDDSTLFIQNEGGNEFLLNDAGGELRGGDTTQLVKLGDSNLRFSASNENFSGQIVIADGFLEANSHGAALGHGTSEILIGSDVAAEGITLPAAYGNVRIGGNVGLVIRDEGGMPGDMIEVTQDIRFLSDTAGENNYYIGAQYMADADVARFSGNIDGTAIASGANAGEQVYFYYVDNYNSRNYGTTSEAERVFIEFTGDITGDFHGRTVTSQGGGASGGFSNTTSGVDNIDEHTYFVFSGDNSAWGSAADRASMEIGLRSNTYDSDRIAFWRAGSDTAFNQYQDMFLKMGSRLQAGGNDVTIGNLVSDADSGGNNNSTIPLNGGVANDGAGTFYAFLENGSNTEGSVTITQTGDHVFTGLIRDGYDPLISSASGELGGEVQNAAELATTEGAALNVVYNGEAEVNLTIATPSTYTGTTIINSGILQAGLGGDGTWNAGATSGDVVGRLGTGDVTVAGGTLAGTGQVQNNLIVDSGFLTPGDEFGGTDGVGTLFVGSDTAGTGNVTFNGGTTTFTLQSTPDYNTNISFEDPGYVYTDPNYTTTVTQGVILGTAPATLDPASFGATGSEIGSSYYDHLEVANDLTWNGGTIKVEANGYTPLAGDIFNLIDWFGVEDWTTFNTGGDLLVGNGDDLGDLDLPDLSANPALRWDTRFFMSDGIIFVVAPEPSRLLLLGMGLITLLRRRRK